MQKSIRQECQLTALQPEFVLQTRHAASGDGDDARVEHNLATHVGGELDAIEVWRRATKYLVQRNPARGRSAQWCRR